VNYIDKTSGEEIYVYDPSRRVTLSKKMLDISNAEYLDNSTELITYGEIMFRVFCFSGAGNRRSWTDENNVVLSMGMVMIMIAIPL